MSSLTWNIPASVFDLSRKEMARDGLKGNEGTALWLGRRDGDTATVTHVITLSGPRIIKKPDYLHIESSLINDVADIAIELDAYIIGQIHSHGIGYSVDLSPTDHQFGIRAPNFLSLVAPDYSLREFLALEECGVHIFRPQTGFYRLTSDEIRKRIATTGGSVGQVEVGENG
jgi:hypothetical protein